MGGVPRNRDLLEIAPIRCESCGSIARVTIVEISGPGAKERWTYTCEKCGHKTVRTVEPPPAA